MPKASRTPTTCRCVHKGRGNTVGGSDDDPALLGHEADGWAYADHLNTTLFAEEGREMWGPVSEMLSHPSFKVSACLTKANRSFHIQCRCCGEGVKGNYGKYNDPTVHEAARQALSKFMLDTPTSNNGNV